MIPFEQAFEICMSSARQLPAEQVDLQSALNRVLARDVQSDMDMPPFDKSAMDGYACRRQDLGRELEVVEFIPAGKAPAERIGPGQCAKIMTGAMIPDGADCVIMVEHTENPGENTVRFTAESTRDNICIKGEDVRVGDVVLPRGAILLPQHVAVLASVGCARPLVARRPRVAVIATGDELVEPDRKPALSQIRNSNGAQLLAQISAAAALPRYFGIASDTVRDIESKLVAAIAESDVVILSGGVSMGELDLVPDVLRDRGVEILFEKVAVRPGMPTVFGVGRDRFFFGLPGNPVSTFILFEVLVKPFLFKLMGCDYAPPNVSMPLAETIRQRRADRLAWMPVALRPDGTVAPVEFHGSAHAGSLCDADGLIAVPIGVTELAEGATVRVRLIRP